MVDAIATGAVVPKITDEKGRFLPGKSGNPKGRPPTRREKIQSIQQKLELAVRRRLDPSDVSEVVHKAVQMAKAGDTAAMKLIFEYTVAKPKHEADVQEKSSNKISIIIENATIKPASPVLEGQFEEK